MNISKEIIKQAQASGNENLIYFAYIIDTMYELYCRKNSCYGNSFGETWEKLGPISGITRLSDKLNRAISLVTGTKSDFESLEDTFIDLANYAVMCEVELLKEKIKEDEKEAEAFNKYLTGNFCKDQLAADILATDINYPDTISTTTVDTITDTQKLVNTIINDSKKHAGKKILVENK